MDVVSFLMTFLPASDLGFVTTLVALAVAICSLIDAHVPPPAPGSIWVIPRKIVSLIAHNIRHAKNIPTTSAPNLVVLPTKKESP